MDFIIKYQNYFLIILISLIFGLARWIFLDKDFPLIGSSEIQKKALGTFAQIMGFNTQRDIYHDLKIIPKYMLLFNMFHMHSFFKIIKSLFFYRRFTPNRTCFSIGKIENSYVIQ